MHVSNGIAEPLVRKGPRTTIIRGGQTSTSTARCCSLVFLFPISDVNLRRYYTNCFPGVKQDRKHSHLYNNTFRTTRGFPRPPRFQSLRGEEKVWRFPIGGHRPSESPPEGVRAVQGLVGRGGPVSRSQDTSTAAHTEKKKKVKTTKHTKPCYHYAPSIQAQQRNQRPELIGVGAGSRRRLINRKPPLPKRKPQQSLKHKNQQQRFHAVFSCAPTRGKEEAPPQESIRQQENAERSLQHKTREEYTKYVLLYTG